MQALADLLGKTLYVEMNCRAGRWREQDGVACAVARPPAARPENAHARARLDACALPLYGHLVREDGPELQFEYMEEAESE